jgi:NAD(P)-dependent dehydrogenase (short-subunit alcohol dehydrogenase family)
MVKSPSRRVPPAASVRPSPGRSPPTGPGLVYTDINLEAARASAAETPGALALRMDVTSESEVESAMAAAMQACGRLDILANNAGVNTMAHRVNIDQFPLEEWERILRVDLTGLFW